MKIIMICGIPSSGKSTISEPLIDQGFVRLNRDTLGGTINDLLPKVEAEILKYKDIVLDNIFPTTQVRKPFIELAKKYNVKIEAHYLTTSVADSQFNAVHRMIKKYGKMLESDEMKKSKDPNMFPVSVIYKYNKEFEKPTVEEGFNAVELIPFERNISKEYNGKALFCDFDGTLRECVGGNGMYPCDPKEVKVLDNRFEVLSKYKENGYRLLGASNQSGIAKGLLTSDQAKKCFDKTLELLGIDIEYMFCPHRSNPISCYCRKPLPGIFVYFFEKYKLDPKQCLMVGDLKSDETFADRSGMKFYHANEFFK